MKVYRDLKLGETLREGDESLADPPQWVPVNQSLFGLSPAAQTLPEYRRPVDLPTLQPVTPEAMAELEGRDSVEIVVLHRGFSWVYAWVDGRWFADDDPDKRPSAGWYIEPSTIPEVQQ